MVKNPLFPIHSILHTSTFPVSLSGRQMWAF